MIIFLLRSSIILISNIQVINHLGRSLLLFGSLSELSRKSLPVGCRDMAPCCLLSPYLLLSEGCCPGLGNQGTEYHALFFVSPC
jgi:hypothetical protein